MNLHDIFCVSGMTNTTSTEGSTVSDEKYSLIETINISTADLSMVVRTSEPDGTPYNFKKMIIKLVAPKGTVKAAGQINVNNQYVVLWRNDLISNESSKVSIAKAAIENGFLNPSAICADTLSDRVYSHQKCDLLFVRLSNIHTISTFIDPTMYHFPVGTIIEIYGIRN